MAIADDKINLENFEQHEGPIDSPRSLEACLRQGIDPVELRPRPLSYFAKPKQNKKVTLMLAEHYEKKRKGKSAK